MYINYNPIKKYRNLLMTLIQQRLLSGKANQLSLIFILIYIRLIAFSSNLSEPNTATVSNQDINDQLPETHW